MATSHLEASTRQTRVWHLWIDALTENCAFNEHSVPALSISVELKEWLKDELKYQTNSDRRNIEGPAQGKTLVQRNTREGSQQARFSR
jgi:hypothetical protein